MSGGAEADSRPQVAHTPPPYGAAANPDLLVRIPLTSKLVIDIGCGAGGLGRAYKRRNPDARVIGIEADETLAAQARAVLDEVHVLDVECAPLPFPDGSVDCVVCGDVLEHLRDPWSLLRRLTALLREDGALLACVPNVEHWSFVERLLRGAWRYEERGLFDQTHLRWFSAATMRQALTEAGLHVLDMAPRIVGQKDFQSFMERLAPSLGALGIDPKAYAARAAPLQHVWRAARQPARQLQISAMLLRPVGGLNDVRVIEPLIAMTTAPGVVGVIGQNPRPPAVQPGTPRIFILQRRTLTEASLPTIRDLRRQGFVVVAEFDDDPDHFPRIRGGEYLTFRAVHAVQTSTEPLAELLRGWNPETIVFPNMLAELPEPANFRDPRRMTLFVGALNRETDTAPLIPALNEVLAEAGDRLAVEVVWDRAFFEALATPHKRFHRLLPYPEYKALLGQCEIALMPLSDTRFNRFKSDVKFVEASGHHVVSIASPVVYGRSIRDGETGLLFRDPGELKHLLRGLLVDPARARAIADAARSWVRSERMLASDIARRLAWYRTLWERREELDAALLRRVPALAA